MPIERFLDATRVGDHAIAHAKRTLGRFNKTVHEIETFCFRHAQAFEQRKYDLPILRPDFVTKDNLEVTW